VVTKVLEEHVPSIFRKEMSEGRHIAINGRIIDSIIIYLKEIRCVIVDWIHLAQCRMQWQFVYKVQEMSWLRLRLVTLQ
jgi:hypothetical protein